MVCVDFGVFWAGSWCLVLVRAGVGGIGCFREISLLEFGVSVFWDLGGFALNSCLF